MIRSHLAFVAVLLLMVPVHAPGQEGPQEPRQDSTAEGHDGELNEQARQPVDEAELEFPEQSDGAVPSDAGDGDQDGAGTDAFRSFGAGEMLRTLVVLALVVALIYAVFWFLKRISPARTRDTKMVRVVGSRTLPGNKHLHLVKVGEQVFLVGAADQSVSLVSEITDRESLDQVQLAASDQPEQPRQSFGEMLGDLFRQSRGLSGGRGVTEEGFSNGVAPYGAHTESEHYTPPEGPAQAGQEDGSRSVRNASKREDGVLGSHSAVQGTATFFEQQRDRLRRL